MVWAKLDDEILDNEKIVRAGILGFALHAAAITWCARNLTDGFIPRRRALTLFDFGELTSEYIEALGSHPQAELDGVIDSTFGLKAPTSEPTVQRLIGCKLWRYDSTRDGYWLKDFLLYNPSRERVLADRSRGNERKRTSRIRNVSRADSACDTPETPSGIRNVSHIDSGTVSHGPDLRSDNSYSLIRSEKDLSKELLGLSRKKRDRQPGKWKFVPKTWEPKQSHREIAEQRRLDFDLELSKFRDHEFAAGKTDADATFRNWLRSARPEMVNGYGKPPGLEVHETLSRLPAHRVFPAEKSGPRMSAVEKAECIGELMGKLGNERGRKD